MLFDDASIGFASLVFEVLDELLSYERANPWPHRTRERHGASAAACLLHELGFAEDRVSETVRRASPAYRILKLNPTL
jgi:hypothetical protein